ncbi:hypothetical protein V1477_014223 [Vespula maculifrons]|uniref:Uncharacterized protein n=1 Tax=Vespula maculifrons TaxID=7453 RepID=A0ABD2BKX5_VESMC
MKLGYVTVSTVLVSCRGLFPDPYNIQRVSKINLRVYERTFGLKDVVTRGPWHRDEEIYIQ